MYSLSGEKDMSVYVYWIHYINQIEPLNEGYIGITNNLNKRYKYHFEGINNDNKLLYESLKKGAIQSVLHVCDNYENALEIEKYYRPKENIGWNLAAGGGMPPSRKGKPGTYGMLGKKHRKESNQQRSKAMKDKKWWNNGSKNVRSIECPEGYVSGKLQFKKYVIKKENHNIGKSGKKIKTPHGNFESIAAASRCLNISWDIINGKINSQKHLDWYYL
jgi:predicted GIY-YIG superfamily endonuclease